MHGRKSLKFPGGPIVAGAVFVLSMLISASHSIGQDRELTLADIRQQLEFLNFEIGFLRNQLLTTETSGRDQPTSGPLILRLDDMEQEIRRLTGEIETLNVRVEQIVEDGTRRIGDLEFRLVSLEGGDVTKLASTTTLGKLDPSEMEAIRRGSSDGFAIDESGDPNSPTGNAGLVQEIADDDFGRALAAIQDNDHLGALHFLEVFLESNASDPRFPEARFWQGESYMALEDWDTAAISYLDSFSSAPDGRLAPNALLGLGTSLAQLGKSREACLALTQISVRYARPPEVIERAEQEIQLLGCG